VLPILIHWHFPRTEMWSGDNPVPARTNVDVQFADAWDAAVHTHRDLAALEARSRAFADAFWTSDLPAPLLDAAGSALSTLRSPTVMRLDDGRIYAWEGSGDQIGSCAGNCTHVWNYEQALAFLFPELERTMREIEFAAGVRADGAMSFRCEAPIGAGNTKFHETPACADGQMGAISQLYRDWQLSGDEEFLARSGRTPNARSSTRGPAQTAGTRTRTASWRAPAQHLRHRILRPKHDDGLALPRGAASRRTHRPPSRR
jgi:hypothetical protein